MKYFVLLFFGMIVFANAQTPQQRDTIYVNNQMNVALFFPDPIVKGIVGNSDFVFSYNREKREGLGLLQGQAGSVSNLLVLTENGHTYSYLLKYKAQLEQWNYFIDADKRINPRKDSIKTDTLFEDKHLITSHPFEVLSKKLLTQNGHLNFRKYHKGIHLKLVNSHYQGDALYLVFEISNASKIDFEVRAFELYSVLGNNKRKTSYQQLLHPEIYAYQKPQIVVKGSSSRFVVVYPKFTLGKHEKLLVKLKEMNGKRTTMLKI